MAGHGRFEPLTGRRVSLTRPRLIRRMQERFSRSVAVVVAPAGFGKTTLLAQAVDENRLAPGGDDVWLTCRPEDAAASSLTDGLCRAVGVDPAPDAGTAIRAVTEAIWHRSPREVALLLDDVHEIPRASPGAQVLATLVAELPRNGHVVLAGRVQPPVALARVEVRGELLRVGEAELSFTRDELAEFAAERGIPGDRLEGCGGWPALAELAASSTGHQAEAAYLWEEVLDDIEPGSRHDLALLAHIGAFDSELAAAALGHEVDLATLTADLPLVSAGPEGGRSIHSLWRPYLARSVTAAEIAAARRRTGLALAASGDVGAAVRLLTEAGAGDDVARVVLDGLGAAHPPVPGDIVVGWQELLPAEARAGPLGQLLDAVGLAHTGPEAAAALLTTAMEGFRASAQLDGEIACVAQLAQLAWWWEQPERMVAVAARVLELEADGHEQAAPLACVARALVADVANDSARALVELDRIPSGSFNRRWQALVDWLRSLSLNHLGRPGEALAAAETARSDPAAIHAPLIEAARLQALWFQGEIDAVIRQLIPLVDRTAAAGLGNYAALMAASCCLALALDDRPQDAAPYLERARHGGSSRQLPLVDVNLAIAEAALAVARGDEPAATAVLEDYLTRSQLLGMGHAAAPQQRTLTLWYVLVPETRAVWDDAPLGASFAVARELARAVVAGRAGRSGAGPPTEALVREVVRPHLPLRWSTELALYEVAAGRARGWTLLESLWPAAQPHVRRLATEGNAAAGRAARSALGRLPVPPDGVLDLRLLGPIELRRDGVPVDAPEWRRERVRSLLAHLAMDRSVSRERLASDLWPTLDRDAQSRNLRVSLTYLLRVLEPGRAERDASFFLRPHGTALTLEGDDRLRVDLWTFDELWRQAGDADQRGAPAEALQHMRQALGLWREDPAELAGEPWALPEVEERQLRLVAMGSRAGELLLAKGEAADARRMSEIVLRADPWSERAHTVAVRAGRALGGPGEAERALERYRAALEDLGLPPQECQRKLDEVSAAP